MVASWRARHPEGGVSVLFKPGRKLVSDCMVKSRLSEMSVMETQFADGAALYSSSRESLESSSRESLESSSKESLESSSRESLESSSRECLE